MKALLYCFITITIIHSAHAQTQKGNGLIGGTASASYSWLQSGNGGNKVDGFSPVLNLTAGRFVADNWLAGLSVSSSLVIARPDAFIFNGQTLIPSDNQQTTLDVTTTPFVRRYFPVGPAYAFVGGGLSVGIDGLRQREQKLTGTGLESTDLHSISWSVNPYLEAGVNYFVSNRLAVQLSASSASLPFSVGNLGLGLVYWTGPNQKTSTVESQENPQTNKGNWVIEGSFSADGTSSNNLNNSSNQATYQLSPSLGYFVGKNTLIGLSIPLTYDQYGAGNFGWSVGISPYYQHYWLATRLTPYTKASVVYNLRTLQAISDNKIETVGADISVGLAYMAAKRFIIETGLASASLSRVEYALNRNQPGFAASTATQWNTSLSAGLRGSVAIRYVLTRQR